MSFSTKSSSFLVPDLVTSIAGNVLLSDNFLSSITSLFKSEDFSSDDFIILVVAPRKNRLNRYLKNGGKKEMFNLLDKNQISPKQKIKFCDYLIVNNKSKNILKKKVHDIINYV